MDKNAVKNCIDMMYNNELSYVARSQFFTDNYITGNYSSYNLLSLYSQEFVCIGAIAAQMYGMCHKDFVWIWYHRRNGNRSEV